MSKWPNSQLLALPREFSDHCPLVLKSSTLDFGPTSFKFFNSWLPNRDLESIVSFSWSNFGILTAFHPTIAFKDKLKKVKGAIKDWRITTFSSRLGFKNSKK